MKTNGNQIKRILKANYPKNNFRVRIDKTGLSTAVYIKTDMLKMTDKLYDEFEDLSWKLREKKELRGADADKYETLEKWIEQDRQAKRNIEATLEKHGIEKRIYRDEKSDEILCGGNVFIFITKIE